MACPPTRPIEHTLGITMRTAKRDSISDVPAAETLIQLSELEFAQPVIGKHPLRVERVAL